MVKTFFEHMMEDMYKTAQENDEAITKAVKETYKPGKDRGVDDVIKSLSPEKRDDYLKKLRESEGDEEKRASGRPMASQIAQSVRPVLVVGYHPQNQSSMIFIKRLDQALQDASGLDRLKIAVLNPMLDRQTIDTLGVPVPGAVIYKSNKKLGEIGGSESAMDILKYLTSNKSTLLS